MRTAAALLLRLALGCGPAPPAGPQLRCVDFNADESLSRLPFLLEVDNASDDAQVDEIELKSLNGRPSAAIKELRATLEVANR